ncbi:DUF5804 family protein [Halosimplex marinum]|uniref:DUF5804 family protein n=1 Tax=Halosimplex marinum TaxID=3396620 RepID=UPI003F557C1E
MTRVCLVGDEDVNLRYELLSRETAREALTTYDLREPFENAVGLETVSLGAAVALLNDLNWYLVRFVDEAMVLEPSVSDEEWLSRDLAAALRDDAVEPDEAARFCKIYGLEPAGADADGGADEAADGDGEVSADGDGGARRGTDGDPAGRKRLVEPMYVTRTGEELPEYDLRDVEETVVERVTESEFGA